MAEEVKAAMTGKHPVLSWGRYFFFWNVPLSLSLMNAKSLPNGKGPSI